MVHYTMWYCTWATENDNPMLDPNGSAKRLLNRSVSMTNHLIMAFHEIQKGQQYIPLLVSAGLGFPTVCLVLPALIPCPTGTTAHAA